MPSRMAREASLRVGLGMPRQVDDRFEGASRTEAVGWHRGPARRRGARVRQGARARYQGPHRSRAGGAEEIRVLGRLRPAAARSWSRLHGAERYAGRSRHGACHGREGRGRPLWRRRSSWLHREQGDQPSTGRAPGAPAPDGWSHDFGGWVAETALRGCSVFTTEDAVTAARRLLAHGPVRLKPARATGGRGQTVVSNMAALDAALAPMDADELARDGLVLEEDLAEVTTRSVGQVRVAGLVASYCGTQQLTPDNDGADVYGGSDLLVVARRLRGVAGPRPLGGGSPRRGPGTHLRRGRDQGVPGPVRVPPQLRRRSGAGRGGPTGVPECWSSPGGSVAPAVRRSQHFWRSGPIPRCRPCAPRRSSATVPASRRRRVPRCCSTARTRASGRSPNTRWWTIMPTRDEAIDIALGEQRIQGTLLAPAT